LASESLKAFFCSKEIEYTLFNKVDSNGNIIENSEHMSKYSTLDVLWLPKENSESPHKDISKIRVRFVPAFDSMNFRIEYDDQSKSGMLKDTVFNYDVKTSSDNESTRLLKKEFIRLYRKIQLYREVEIPKREKEKCVNLICDLFPSIMDSVLFGEQGD
jgi:hypothetical protein